jgi:type II secretory pathway pseudopilin PulG
MLTEIIIYIALFAVLFSGAFSAVFQTIDEVKYLQVQKETVGDLYFLQSRLDLLVGSNPDWGVLSEDFVEQTISDFDLDLPIESFSSQIFETATSSSRVLVLTFGINKKVYTFSYVQEK